MQFFEYDPSDLQSEEDMTRAGCDELTELRDVIRPVAFDLVRPEGFHRNGTVESYAFDEFVFDDIDEQGVQTETECNGSFWVDGLNPDSFGLSLVLCESLAANTGQDVQLVKSIDIVVLEGVVIGASLKTGLLENFDTVCDTSEITSYDVGEWLARLKDYALQVKEAALEDESDF